MSRGEGSLGMHRAEAGPRSLRSMIVLVMRVAPLEPPRSSSCNFFSSSFRSVAFSRDFCQASQRSFQTPRKTNRRLNHKSETENENLVATKSETKSRASTRINEPVALNRALNQSESRSPTIPPAFKDQPKVK